MSVVVFSSGSAKDELSLTRAVVSGSEPQRYLSLTTAPCGTADVKVKRMRSALIRCAEVMPTGDPLLSTENPVMPGDRRDIVSTAVSYLNIHVLRFPAKAAEVIAGPR